MTSGCCSRRTRSSQADTEGRYHRALPSNDEPVLIYLGVMDDTCAGPTGDSAVAVNWKRRIDLAGSPRPPKECASGVERGSSTLTSQADLKVRLYGVLERCPAGMLVDLESGS